MSQASHRRAQSVTLRGSLRGLAWLRLGLLTLVLTLVSGLAFAWFSTSSTVGSSGAAAAAMVNAGATPTAAVSGGTIVTLSWPASTMTNGAAVTGYTVARYDASTSVKQTILSNCTGTVTATTCTETGVPVGTWKYTVTPVVGAAWVGSESAKSASVTTDSTAPTNNITLAVGSGSAYLSGTTVYYRGSSDGSLKLVNAVADSGSGPASSPTSTLTGSTTGWTHSPTTESTPVGGPFTSATFSWTAGTTSSPVEVVTGRDAAGNATATTLTFVNDSSGPSGGSVVATGLVGTGGAYSTSTTLHLTLAKGSDPNGLAASGAQLQRATATLTNGVCGTFGGYTLVTTDPVASTADAVSDQACYSYQYVASDVLGNTTTYASAPIKVDSTVPSTPSLTFFTGANTSQTGSTIYYRPTAATGGFTAYASSTDTASGIASYAWPTLGTGWTSTPSGIAQNGYSWSSANPAVPGTKTVTATNNAGGTSGTSSFTLTADSTAPSGASISYSSATQSTNTVPITLTLGSDAGSGVMTRTVQRLSTSLTGTTCGTTYGQPVGVSMNPGTSYTDTAPRGFCYKYQLVVTDNVGNAVTATSNSVVKMQPYADVIAATTGLVNYWRMGEATISSDTFTGSAGTLLSAHIGEIGASWTRNGSISTADMVITDAGRIRKSGTSTGFAEYYSSATPASANYTVEADVTYLSNVAGDLAGVIGRVDTAAANGTFYSAAYDRTTGAWTLYNAVNGSTAVLGSYAQTLTPGTTYRLSLDMTGTTIRLLVDGTQLVSVTNSSISAAGRAGVVFGNGTATTITDSTGLQIDRFLVSPQVADVKAANTGDYFGVQLGEAGAMSDSSNTAASFDGVNDFASITETVAGNYSIEFWLKSTQGIGTGTTWQSGAGLVDANITGNNKDWGISLRSDGKVIAGNGNGSADFSVVSTNSTPVNNGAWHQIVVTRIQSSGLISIYVDGVAAGSGTGSTVALTSPTINIGRLASAANYFAGSLDEIAVYNTALSAATITTHYNAGH